MKRLVTDYSPGGSCLTITKVECAYKTYKEATTFAAGQKEGIHTSVWFDVKFPESKNESENTPATEIQNIEAVEFIFALYDVFDRFLTSVQGLAGPGKYKANSKKPHRSRWVFDVDDAFTQYHALCFPAHIRFEDGTIWHCDRGEVIQWLNSTMTESNEKVEVGDIFLEGATREGVTE